MAWSQSLLLLVAFLSVVVVDAGVVRDDPDTKIIGGQVVKIEEVPWQVLLITPYNSTHVKMCGGSIISNRWVISAAHCTKDFEYRPHDITMLIGTNAVNDDIQHKYQAEKVINHNFNRFKLLNDISLVKTKTVLNLDGHPLKAVRLPEKGAPRPPVNTPLTVSGWGRTEKNESSTLLKAVEIKVRKFSDCSGKNESTQICAGLNGKDSCYGDSGGPLVNGDVLVGIVSHGHIMYGCAEGPTIYTYVPAFIDWINEKINSN